jgi:hypothetical protein
LNEIGKIWDSRCLIHFKTKKLAGNYPALGVLDSTLIFSVVKEREIQPVEFYRDIKFILSKRSFLHLKKLEVNKLAIPRDQNPRLPIWSPYGTLSNFQLSTTFFIPTRLAIFISGPKSLTANQRVYFL